MKKGSLSFQEQFSKNQTKRRSATGGMIRKIRELLHHYQLQGSHPAEGMTVSRIEQQGWREVEDEWFSWEEGQMTRRFLA